MPAINAPVLQSLAACLFVADVRASAAYYARMGFETAYLYGDPPYYGEVRRDAARLCLRLVCGPVYAGDVRTRETLIAAAIDLTTAAEADRLARDFAAAGIVLHQPPRDEPWGARTFIVADPDGNLILFAGAAGPA